MQFVVVVECIIEYENKFLFIRRPMGVHAEGLLSFPGGKFEMSDANMGSDVLVQAVKREIFEEAGLTLQDEIRYVTSSCFPDSKKNDYVVDTIFHCKLIKTDPTVTASPREVVNYYWYSYDQIKSIKEMPEWVLRYMSSLLNTKRLIIHLAQTVSAEAIVNYYVASKDHFASTEAPRPPSFYTRDYWDEQILTMKKEFESDQSVRFVLSLIDSPSQVIGTINFTQICRGPFQACYLGYAISHEQQGKGLMTEALQEAIRYLFDEKNIHRIMANYLPSNIASEKVLKKLGFAIEGRADRYLFINGEWREHILTSLTNDHWQS